MTEPILTSEAWNKFILVCLGNLGTCDALITVTLAVLFTAFVGFFLKLINYKIILILSSYHAFHVCLQIIRFW